MRKVCISFLIVGIIILSVMGVILPKETETKEYLRIHVRAASNSEIDQQVKYKVKDAVVNFLTPYIVECDTKKMAEDMLKENLTAIEKVANRVLKENGFTYTAKAQVKNEEFPTRIYEDVELEAGFYDALILELGGGAGDNWWCVVYPPLCFKGQGNSYVYKSKIKEIIDSFFNKEN